MMKVLCDTMRTQAFSQYFFTSAVYEHCHIPPKVIYAVGWRMLSVSEYFQFSKDSVFPFVPIILFLFIHLSFHHMAAKHVYIKKTIQIHKS